MGQQTSKIIVESCGVKGHFNFQVFFRSFYIPNLETEKKVFPDIAEKAKQLLSMQGYGMQRTYKIANLISKLNFYKLIPYPMDNSLSGRRRPARQTSEKDVLCLHSYITDI